MVGLIYGRCVGWLRKMHVVFTRDVESLCHDITAVACIWYNLYSWQGVLPSQKASLQRDLETFRKKKYTDRFQI